MFNDSRNGCSILIYLFINCQKIILKWWFYWQSLGKVHENGQLKVEYEGEMEDVYNTPRRLHSTNTDQSNHHAEGENTKGGEMEDVYNIPRPMAHASNHGGFNVRDPSKDYSYVRHGGQSENDDDDDAYNYPSSFNREGSSAEGYSHGSRNPKYVATYDIIIIRPDTASQFEFGFIFGSPSFLSTVLLSIVKFSVHCLVYESTSPQFSPPFHQSLVRSTTVHGSPAYQLRSTL